MMGRSRFFMAGVLVMVALSATGCSSMKKGGERMSDMRPDRVEVEMDRQGMKRAVQSPLYDLNFKRDEIPVQLANLNNIYTPPPAPSCINMEVEIDTLNEVLGPDSILTSGDDETVWTLDANGALESSVNSFIPFQDVIRYVSGANKHEKALAAAYFKGQIRRAYLRGWSAERGCNVPRPRVKPQFAEATS